MPLQQEQTTILVVDDEEEVIQAVCETLRDSDYRLITTTDPHHALTILRGDEIVHLLVLDLFMPLMDGAELLREGRRIRPALKAVLITGAASDEEFRKWSRRGELLVWKPWGEEEFRSAVTKALGKRHQG
jgi:CheY-like chemotaxis protein